MELYISNDETEWFLHGEKVSPSGIVEPHSLFIPRSGYFILELIEDGRLEVRKSVRLEPNPKLVKVVEMMKRVAGTGPWKVEAIGAIRTLTGSGLKEAKDFVESVVES